MVDKKRQFEIISTNNPFNPSLGEHTWIRSVSDINTYEEAWEDEGEIYGITPDFSKEDAIKALKSGIITVYSSYPIKQGIFVTPSRMEAQSYAGGNRVFSKTVRLSDVAWIDPTQGQYANINENKKYMKKIIRLTESDLRRIVSNSVRRVLKEEYNQFENWFNSTLGDSLSRIIYQKIKSGDFATDAESGY